MRRYQPYFVNDGRPVSDASLCLNGHADAYEYDALGREARVVTARGHERREHRYPWFSVSEDENDTLAQDGMQK